MLAELDAAAAELAAEHGTVTGNVVIGAFPSAAVQLAVPAVRELHARHAELDCNVREHEPEDGIPLLRSGALDVLISERYDNVAPAPAGGLEEHLLLSEPLLLVLPADHPGEDPVDLTTLAGEPWIGGLAGTQYASRWSWRAEPRASSPGSPTPPTRPRSTTRWLRPGSASPSCPPSPATASKACDTHRPRPPRPAATSPRSRAAEPTGAPPSPPCSTPCGLPRARGCLAADSG